MVSDPYDSTDTVTGTESSATDDFSNPLLNGVIGGVVGVVISFVPFSTLVGGAVAGYLQGGDVDEGIRVGAIAGLVMFVPLLLFGLFATTFMGLGFGMMGPAIPFGGMVLFGVLIGGFYTVGLGIVGGYLGVYIKQETSTSRPRNRHR